MKCIIIVDLDNDIFTGDPGWKTEVLNRVVWKAIDDLQYDWNERGTYSSQATGEDKPLLTLEIVKGGAE